MSDEKKLNEKQKKFIDDFNKLGDWHYIETLKKVRELLKNCKLTKKELEELLDNDSIHKFSNDKYLYDEIIDNVYENDTSAYNISELKDDDIVGVIKE